VLQQDLVLQQEDLEILVAVGTLPHADQVDEVRYETRKHGPAHEVPPHLLLIGRRFGPLLLW
jgi:hypothetical protein